MVGSEGHHADVHFDPGGARCRIQMQLEGVPSNRGVPRVDPPSHLAFPSCGSHPTPDDVETEVAFADVDGSTELALTQGPFKRRNAARSTTTGGRTHSTGSNGSSRTDLTQSVRPYLASFRSARTPPARHTSAKTNGAPPPR